MTIFPQWGSYLFMANVWLLSYPHTVATYQRSYFSIRRNRIFVSFVFLCFVALNALLYRKYDLVMLMNGYFYLQFFHYFRQNYGISKIYSKDWNIVDSWLFHLVNLAGLLALGKEKIVFFGYGLTGLKLFPGQEKIFYIILSLYVLRLSFGFFKKQKHSPMLYIHLALLGLTVSIPGYFMLGWLGLHLFHNIQYLYMNWKLNKRVPFLWSYLKALSLVIVLYRTSYRIDKAISYFIPFSFIVILSVNYSHYFFDTYLWKRKYRESFP